MKDNKNQGIQDADFVTTVVGAIDEVFAQPMANCVGIVVAKITSCKLFTKEALASKHGNSTYSSRQLR